MKLSNTLIILSCLSLAACLENANTPKQVSEQYWQAIKNGDITAAKKLVTKGSQPDMDNYFALSSEDKISLDEILLSDEHARVKTTVISKTTNLDQTEQEKSRTAFDTILVLEDGHWKIDTSRSQLPSLEKTADVSSDQLSEAFQENLDTMDEALGEGAEILNKFMQEGSKEMSETLLKGMNKMNESLREAVEKMKQRREQQKQEQPANEPESQNGEGLL